MFRPLKIDTCMCTFSKDTCIKLSHCSNQMKNTRPRSFIILPNIRCIYVYCVNFSKINTHNFSDPCWTCRIQPLMTKRWRSWWPRCTRPPISAMAQTSPLRTSRGFLPLMNTLELCKRPPLIWTVSTCTIW